MADTIKSPNNCSSAVFINEEPQGSTRVVKFSGCSAWLDLDLVNLNPYGLEHRARWERVPVGMDPLAEQKTRESIGERCVSLCSNCSRYKPAISFSDVSTAGYSSDPEFSPDPTMPNGARTVNITPEAKRILLDRLEEGYEEIVLGKKPE